MAEKRLFALRKHLNAVHRLSFQRAYTGSSDSPKQLTDPKEQTAYLRAADQKCLQDARDALDAFLANTEKIRHYIDTIPTQLKLHNSPIPPYTYTVVRARDHFRTALQRLHEAGANVQGHFADLMETEYPEHGDNSADMEWREQIDNMSEEQRAQLWMGLKMQEDAGVQRLKAESQRLGDEIKRSQGMFVEDPWMQANVEEVKAGGKVDGGRRGRRGRTVKRVQGNGSGNGVGGDHEAIRAAPSPAPAPATRSAGGLADLQAQLEATGFQSKT
ncbi:hypothetical protein EJ03DRAFT_325733 [Teratosphaeria nubilosa]|uniref:Uncharacterized protein n=1 Tax=Teratosphaeria nubilosa TaxID=161662 RepID=A0A6G1LGK1_9PEZI|nr:hypothetical protein EJ03DRAFT_325733 [Teratosphaeria nubilosa]